jgi:hypothetical protein
VTRGVKSVKEKEGEKRETIEISLEKCVLNNFLVQNIMLLHVPCLKRTAQSALTCQTLGNCSGDNLEQKMNIN